MYIIPAEIPVDELTWDSHRFRHYKSDNKQILENSGKLLRFSFSNLEIRI